MIPTKIKVQKGFRDVFNLFMINPDELHGDLQMPKIAKYTGPIPEKLIDFTKRPTHPEEFFCHHYLYDYLFDNNDGLWRGRVDESDFYKKRVEHLKEFSGVISPDYSLYEDMPFVMQLWNIFRSKVICNWLRSQGINCIYNVRWGDYRTYDAVFDGVEKGSIVAVGSHGSVLNALKRDNFESGFKEMIKRIEPTKIIVYGALTDFIQKICDEKNIEIIHFGGEHRGGK